MRKNHWDHAIPFLGGIARFNASKTGPRNYRVVGVLSYGENAKIGFIVRDLEIRVQVNASKLLPKLVPADFADALSAVLPGIIQAITTNGKGP